MSHEHRSERPPNIVFFMSDDQRHDFMSCAGHPFMETPAMDRLAAEGVRFANAFTACPLCAPSRAAHLSGVYPHVNGVFHNQSDMAEDVVTWPERLQEAGYRTGFVGKIHYGNTADPKPGFDRWVSFRNQGEYVDPTLNVDGKEVEHSGYNTDLLADYAIDFIQSSDDRPWALCVWFKAPHGPFIPPERYKDLYSDVPLAPPTTIEAPLTGKTRSMREGTPRGHDRNWYPDGPFVDGKTWEQTVRDYARTLKGVDDAIGRVLDCLDERGETDRTLVIHSSDHGYFLGEFQLVDKRWMYESSIRVPLVVRYPELTKDPGRTEDELVLSLDVPATITDLAGVGTPPEYQGHSLRPLLSRSGAWERDSVFVEYFEPLPFPAIPTMVCVRTQTAKLIHYLRPGESDEYYDLEKDPQERWNVIDDVNYAADVAMMRRRLESDMARYRYRNPF